MKRWCYIRSRKYGFLSVYLTPFPIKQEESINDKSYLGNSASYPQEEKL